jgi:hypothetical protein
MSSSTTREGAVMTVCDATVVVILYVHPLLGQGLAHHVRDARGVEVLAISASDRDAVVSALSRRPGVVVFENCSTLDDLDLPALAPDAAFIDVSTVVATAGAIPAQGETPLAETIVHAVDAAGITPHRTCRD